MNRGFIKFLCSRLVGFFSLKLGTMPTPAGTVFLV